MRSSANLDHPTQINLVGSSKRTDSSETVIEPRPPRESKDATTTTSNQAKHWRVQFIKLSTAADSNRGRPGVTPPYCPAGPPLYRETFEDDEEPIVEPLFRNKSPLRNLIYSHHQPQSQPQSVNIRYDTSLKTSGLQHMPHAVSMPQSGFQALILCGPGIGLSTFTSVPSEYPKALINVANRPMVWYVLDWCYRMGVTNITLVTPPSANATFAAALAQNPYLTSLPSPSPNLLSPKGLEFTTPTAELLRLPEVQDVIESDFLLLPCDLVCSISGDAFLESYLTSMGGLGGVGATETSFANSSSTQNFSLGGEGSGRRGGLSIWYNTADREESVKGEECDFMGTVKLDSKNAIPMPQHSELPEGSLRKLVWTTPMSELWDQVEQDKSWKIRQSLLRKYGSVKCMTRFRDSHIYFFPHWVKQFAVLNEDFESVSEDLVGTWAKAEWRKPSYRAKFGAREVFGSKKAQMEDSQQIERPIEDDIDLMSLSSTQVTQHIPNTTEDPRPTAQLASRVQAGPDGNILSPDLGAEDDPESASGVIPIVPPILSFVLPSDPSTPLLRRVDTTPLLLSVSLLLAKLPSIEEIAVKSGSVSPFAHASKVAGTASIAQKTTISRSDTLIDSNSSIATQCVIKNSCIGSNVSIGQGARITGCVIMDGATIGEKCVLTGTVIGKKAKIGKGCTLNNCEVQDGNAIGGGTEGKGEKYLIGGLEDEMSGDDYDYGDDDGAIDDEEGIALDG